MALAILCWVWALAFQLIDLIILCCGLASQSSLMLFVTSLSWRHAIAEAKLPNAVMAIDLNRIQQALILTNETDQAVASQAFLHSLQSINPCYCLILLATHFACKKLFKMPMITFLTSSP
jgi:hypothetical protein